MSTHNICFCGAIRKKLTFGLKKASYQELWCESVERYNLALVSNKE